MLYSTVLISALAAIAQARYVRRPHRRPTLLILHSFGQENVPIQAISDVTSGGQPGQAATLGGAAISTLLGAASPCDKVFQDRNRRYST